MQIWNLLTALVYKALNNGFYNGLFSLISFLYQWGLGAAPALFADALRDSNLAGTYANGSSGVGATLTKASAGAFPTVDGVTAQVGNVYLLTGQSTALQNGLYTLTNAGSSSVAWVLTRFAGQGSSNLNPWNVSANMVNGSLFLIKSGTTYGGKVWAYTAASSPTVGVTSLTFAADSLLRAAVAATITAIQTFADGTLKVLNSGGTFTTTIKTGATANRTATFADGTGTAPIVTSTGNGLIRHGTVTLVAGTATVTDTAVTANTRIVLTATTLTPGAGNLTISFSVPTKTASTSFVVRANLADGTINNLDTSVLDYIAIG